VRAWYEDLIERIRGVQGGAPVVLGTRTPVRTIVVLSRTTYPDRPEQVRAALPHLTPRQIEAAMAFYRDRAPQVDADIERNREALRPFLLAS